MTNPALLTTAEVAAIFQVTEATVMRWARTGRIPVVRLPGGGGNRYRQADVDELLAPTEASS